MSRPCGARCVVKLQTQANTRHLHLIMEKAWFVDIIVPVRHPGYKRRSHVSTAGRNYNHNE